MAGQPGRRLTLGLCWEQLLILREVQLRGALRDIWQPYIGRNQTGQVITRKQAESGHGKSTTVLGRLYLLNNRTCSCQFLSSLCCPSKVQLDIGFSLREEVSDRRLNNGLHHLEGAAYCRWPDNDVCRLLSTGQNNVELGHWGGGHQGERGAELVGANNGEQVTGICLLVCYCHSCLTGWLGSECWVK